MKRMQEFWVWLMALTTITLMGCAEERPYDYDYAYPPPPYGYYEYYYYPDVEVYYYPRSRVYWWYEGDHWRSTRHVPPNIELHEHVRVTLDSREPWRHHDEIRQKYSHPRPAPPPPVVRPEPPPRPEPPLPEAPRLGH